MLMRTQICIDYNHVPEHHKGIHARLENWARMDGSMALWYVVVIYRRFLYAHQHALPFSSFSLARYSCLIAISSSRCHLCGVLSAHSSA